MGLSGPYPVQSLPYADEFGHDFITGHAYDVGTFYGSEHLAMRPSQMLPVQILLNADFLGKHGPVSSYLAGGCIRGVPGVNGRKPPMHWCTAGVLRCGFKNGSHLFRKYPHQNSGGKCVEALGSGLGRWGLCGYGISRTPVLT